MAILIDFFDPNTWEVNNWEYRIYADDYANVYAVVDQLDYQYLIQWRWKLSISGKHKGTKKPKAYLARAVPVIVGKDYRDENGARKQQRITSTVYMHRVIMDRMDVLKPPTNKKLIVDHADGDGFNCRRNNLRWATISFNNMNRYGSHEQMLEGLQRCFMLGKKLNV